MIYEIFVILIPIFKNQIGFFLNLMKKTLYFGSIKEISEGYYGSYFKYGNGNWKRDRSFDSVDFYFACSLRRFYCLTLIPLYSLLADG